MPATSKAQQRMFGIARAVQKGDMPASKAKAPARKVAKTVSKKDVNDFASTPSKGLPDRVKKESALAALEEKLGRKLTVPEKHQLAIAYKTVKMPEPMVGVMGGMTTAQAKAIIKRLTGKDYEPRKETLSIVDKDVGRVPEEPADTGYGAPPEELEKVREYVSKLVKEVLEEDDMQEGGLFGGEKYNIWYKVDNEGPLKQGSISASSPAKALQKAISKFHNAFVYKLELAEGLNEAGGSIPAKLLMKADERIRDKLGAMSAQDIEKKWKQYIALVSKVIGNKPVSEYAIQDLEDNNYHTLIKALTQLGNIVEGIEEAEGANSRAAQQAKKLGLTHVGFGHYGKKVGNKTTVTHVSKRGVLVPVKSPQTMKPIPKDVQKKQFPSQKDMGKASQASTIDSDEWFDDVVDFSSGKEGTIAMEDRALDALRKLSKSAPTKATIAKVRDVAKMFQSRPAMLKVSKHADDVLKNKYSKEFRNQFGGGPFKGGFRVSAASAFLSNLRQALFYNESVVREATRVEREAEKGIKEAKQPSIKTMEKWMETGVARATDGCKVEPDGYCPHGKPSWLIAMGLI